MKIKKKVLNKINTPYDRTRIALALGQGEQSVALMCRKNAVNGPLTKAAALIAIREITGLGDEDILEQDKVNTNGR
jgi:hypothetical protein